MVHLRADEIDGARRVPAVPSATLGSNWLGDEQSHGTRIVETCSRPAASGKRARARASSKFLIYLVCALNKSYAVAPSPFPRAPWTRMYVRKPSISAREVALEIGARKEKSRMMSLALTRGDEMKAGAQKSNITKYTLTRVNQREHSTRKDSNKTFILRSRTFIRHVWFSVQYLDM